MKLLWVRSDAIGSRIITWGTGSISSHFAVEYKGIVVHSYLIGVHATLASKFHSSYNVVHGLQFDLPTVVIDRIWDGMLQKKCGEFYDYPALAYWVVAAVAKKFFRVPLPKQNAWQNKDWSLCTEVARGISNNLPDRPLKHVDLAMVLPDELYSILETVPYLKPLEAT